jgi:Uma2 family endonuclease
MTPAIAAPSGSSPPHAPDDKYFYGWRFVERKENGTVVREQVPLTEWDVLHPNEDDFVVQNDAHNQICLYLKDVFRWKLAGRPDWLVLQDHRIDWQTAGLVPHGPDLAVFSGAGQWNHLRGTYPVRDMGVTPVLVVEVTSPSTRNNDLDDKVTDYYRAGIPLYVIVDLREGPAGAEIRFLAYRPSPEGPVRVLSPEPNRVWLPAVDLWLAAEGEQVVCLNPDGTPVGDYTAVAQLAIEAEARAEAEARRADAEKIRADEATALATAEKTRAEEATALATAEKARADEATRKLAELEAELRRLRSESTPNITNPSS